MKIRVLLQHPYDEYLLRMIMFIRCKFCLMTGGSHYRIFITYVRFGGYHRYVAPEVIRSQPYGTAVDMWSVGVILYILLCGFPPFYDDNNKKLFKLIVNASYSFPDPYWTTISPAAKDLISKLLVIDPQQRLSASQALAHPWISDVAASSSLPISIKENLTSFNARRRMKSAIRAVQIGLLFARSGKMRASIADTVAAGDSDKRSRSIDNSDVCGGSASATALMADDMIQFAPEDNESTKFNPKLYSDSSDNDSITSEHSGFSISTPNISMKESAAPMLSGKMLSKIVERSFRDNADFDGDLSASGGHHSIGGNSPAVVG